MRRFWICKKAIELRESVKDEKSAMTVNGTWKCTALYRASIQILGKFYITLLLNHTIDNKPVQHPQLAD